MRYGQVLATGGHGQSKGERYQRSNGDKVQVVEDADQLPFVHIGLAYDPGSLPCFSLASPLLNVTTYPWSGLWFPKSNLGACLHAVLSAHGPFYLYFASDHVLRQ